MEACKIGSKSVCRTLKGHEKVVGSGTLKIIERKSIQSPGGNEGVRDMDTAEWFIFKSNGA